MSLRSKILLVLGLLIGLYGLGTDTVQRRIFFRRFEQIEVQRANEDLDRVIEALQREVSDVEALALRWSAWDDACAFVSGERTAEFERSNLGPENLRRQGIDLLFFLAPEVGGANRVLWSALRDPETGAPITLRDFPQQSLLSSHPLLVQAGWFRGGESGGGTSGFLLTEADWPLIVSAHPILHTDGRGSPAGTLVLGRFLGTGVTERLNALTRVEFQARQVGDRIAEGPEEAEIWDQVTSSPRHVVTEVDESTLYVYGTFTDLRNRPEILLKARIERDITDTGRTAMSFGLVSTVAGGFVLLLALTWLLQHMVLAPLFRLKEHAVRIGREEDFRAQLGLERTDEIGTLSREFDSMMAKLEDARSELVDTARSAGKSEIATGILHNVGNVLNSVNISTLMIRQIVDEMSVKDLEQVNQILSENKDDLARFLTEDSRGQYLQPFLAAIGNQLGEERSQLCNELSSLAEGVEHICELIKSQQSFAVKTSLEEELQLASRMDEALRITEQALPPEPDLVVVRDYDDLPDVLVDKHRLLEILVNLVQNARQAMQGQPGTKTLTVSIRDAGETVRLAVQDSGAGIPPDVLPRIFNLGFTTKSQGHGYGLHTAAIAATEMGGSLRAESDGPGTGARFVLELPLRVRERTGGGM